VGRLGAGGNANGLSGVLKRSLQPTGYLHSRTDEHSPQGDIDSQSLKHGFFRLEARLVEQFPKLIRFIPPRI
jgi:hypothetical protein